MAGEWGDGGEEWGERVVEREWKWFQRVRESVWVSGE